MIGPKRSSKEDNTDEQSHFTFYDVDDTLLHLSFNDRECNHIKNPHLLLPILLFQHHAPNQHFGILTNRSPNELGIDFPVAKLLSLFESFGIVFAPRHVLFGGGENMMPIIQAHSRIETAQKKADLDIDELSAQMAALSVTRRGEALVRQEKSKKQFETILNMRFSGKNFALLNFMNERFDAKTNRFRFDTGDCSRNTLTTVMVDDLDTIAGAISELGEGFIGIKAARGGRPIGEGDTAEGDDDYGQADYLYQLAETIGFDRYATMMKRHNIQTTPLLRISVLLYLWQKAPHGSNYLEVIDALESLKEREFNQIYAMLFYIEQPENRTASTPYHSVQILINYCHQRLDKQFLQYVIEDYYELAKQNEEAHSSQHSQSESNLLSSNTKTKSGLFALLTRRISQRKQAVQEAKQLSPVEQSMDAILNRLRQLQNSENKEIAHLAKLKLLSLTSHSSEHAEHASNLLRVKSSSAIPSPSLSPSASTSSTSESPIEVQALDLSDQNLRRRASYTPAAKNNARELRAESIAVDDTSPKPQKSKSELKKVSHM